MIESKGKGLRNKALAVGCWAAVFLTLSVWYCYCWCNSLAQQLTLRCIMDKQR